MRDQNRNLATQYTKNAKFASLIHGAACLQQQPSKMLGRAHEFRHRLQVGAQNCP